MKRANRTALGTHWQGWAQGYLVLPRSPRHEPDPPAQHIRRGYLEHRDELQAEAILCCNRDRIARLAWYLTHMPPAAAFQAQSSSRQLRACILCVKHNEHAACWLTSPQISAGRGRFCARVASELLDARLPSECARVERYSGAHGRLTPVRDRCQRETA